MSDGMVTTLPSGSDAQLMVLMQLVRSVGEVTAIARTTQTDVSQMRQELGRQVGDLQERVGKSEALNQVQDQRLIGVEKTQSDARAEREAMREDITKLRIQAAVFAAGGAILSSALTALVTTLIIRALVGGF